MMVITILSVPVSWILARASGDGGDDGDDDNNHENDNDMSVVDLMKAGKQCHYCPVRLTSQLIGRLNRVIKDFCLRPLFATSKGISPCSISGYDVSLNPEKNATQTLQTIDEV